MTRDSIWRPTRRRLALGGVVAAFPLPAIAQSPAEVNVGIVNASSDVEVFLAQKKGWFRDEGINVLTHEFRSAIDMVAPLAAGQLDVGGGSVSAGLYNSYGRGIRLRVVADKASSQPGYGVNKCIVAKRHAESGRFKTMSDLKGMKIAMNGPGNSAWGTLAIILRQAGLTFADIETVDLNYPDHVLAMGNGSIDGGITTEPSATVSILKGYAIEATTDDKVRPKHAIAQILYSEKMAANSDLATRFMRAYLRSVRYYFAGLKGGRLAGENADEIISVLTEFTAIKDPAVYRSIVPNGVDPDGRIDVASLDEDREVYRQKGWLQADTRVEQIVDMSFVEAAIKAMGPYKPT